MMRMGQKGLTAIQYDKETESWRKILDILRQETILLKNKLAEILKDNTKNSHEMVDSAEYYQSCFLQQDETIRLMSNDLADYEKLVEKGDSWNKSELRKLNQARKKIKKETENLEANFSKLQVGFNIYLNSMGFDP
jgi:hypothetical protein